MGYWGKTIKLYLPNVSICREIASGRSAGGGASSRPFLLLNVEKRFIESLFLILGGSIFSLFTMYCCNWHHDPGAMHLQLGLFLLLSGVWGMLLYYISSLRDRIFNFVPMLVCFVLAVLLIEHAQNNHFLMLMHYVLAVVLFSTALLEIAASMNEKFVVLLVWVTW